MVSFAFIPEYQMSIKFIQAYQCCLLHSFQHIVSNVSSIHPSISVFSIIYFIPAYQCCIFHSSQHISAVYSIHLNITVLSILQYLPTPHFCRLYSKHNIHQLQSVILSLALTTAQLFQYSNNTVACSSKYVYQCFLLHLSHTTTAFSPHLALGTATEGSIPIYVFPEMKLLFPKQNYNVLSLRSYTDISVRDLYISRISLPILLQGNRWTYPRNI